MEQLKTDLINWLKQYLTTSNKKGYVLGVSGGLDSAICAKLLVLAKIPTDFIFISDERHNPKSSAEDSMHALNSIEGYTTECNQCFKYIVLDHILNDFDFDNTALLGDNANWALKNAVARFRALYLYTIAQSKDYLVLGTTNKSENFIGYFTKGGDGLSDLEPLINLTKTELREFARYIGVDNEIIEKAPAAGLGISKTDEDEMGFTYEQLDSFIERYGSELTMTFDDKIDNIILEKHLNSDFKRKMPPAFDAPIVENRRDCVYHVILNREKICSDNELRPLLQYYNFKAYIENISGLNIYFALKDSKRLLIVPHNLIKVMTPASSTNEN